MAELDNLDVKIYSRNSRTMAESRSRGEKALPERRVNRGIGLRG
ncbi:MAG: hypothetical protein Q8N79_00650 [Candidatus Methanoperedens sp.]|nr:hypothetical protein [Candidatus Methanoperedens sp.]